jgi:tRNA dimethylallyltransferase
MSIGTAVPSLNELSVVPHHFIQNKSIFDHYSVGHFEKDALQKIKELFKKKNVIIMVGGSGLYVEAVLTGLDHFPDVSPEIRKRLKEQLEMEGIESLQKLLLQLDAETYHDIEIQNPHRLIRALEICLETGKKYTSFKNNPKEKRNFNSILIGLDADRKEIYNRIELRVDLMIAQGLLDEAKTLFSHRNLNALQTVGYKELFEYLEGKVTLDFAISEIKKNTRRFAKRQNTWFKKNENIKWFDYQTPLQEIITYIDGNES